MNAGRQAQADLERQYPAVLFAKPDLHSHLEFIGAGRKRTSQQREEAATRRDKDQRTAVRLSRQGINAYSNRGDLTVVDLATKGELVGETRAEFRRLPVLIEQEYRAQRRAALEIEAFTACQPHAPRPEQIVHVRLRPLSGTVRTCDLRQFHRNLVNNLSNHLEYVQKQYGAEPLAWSVHHRPMFDGSFIDWHVHLMIVLDNDNLEDFYKYIGDRYDWWLQTVEHENVGGLGWYLGGCVARYADDFTDENLAEYVRQSIKLHRHQSLGPLRRFLASAKNSQRRAAKNILDEPVLAPVAPRPPRTAKVCKTAQGPTVAACRLSWIGDELRPVLLIRNWDSDWAALSARYDLDLPVAAARHALSFHTSSYTTVNPKSNKVSAQPNIVQSSFENASSPLSDLSWSSSDSGTGNPDDIPW